MHFRILKMIATSGFLTALEFTKFVFSWSSAADTCVLAVVCLSVILLSLDADAQSTVDDESSQCNQEEVASLLVVTNRISHTSGYTRATDLLDIRLL